MIDTIGPGPCNANAHYFGPPETATWTSCHCGDRESTHIGDKWHVRPAMRTAAALLVASREPGQVGLHVRAELESLRRYSAIPDVRVAVAPPPPMTPERADAMIAAFERAHAAGAFAAPVPAGYRFENFGSRPAPGATSTTFPATPLEAKASIEMAEPTKPRECPLCLADLTTLTSWQHSIVWPGFVTTLVTCTKDACMAWAQRCEEQAAAARRHAHEIATDGIPIGKAPTAEQLPEVYARLDEIRRAQRQPLAFDHAAADEWLRSTFDLPRQPPARPDGFAQSQVDAAKAVLLASVPRKGTK